MAPADQLRTPIALLIFRRPELTQMVMDRIALARPSRLLVVADGPRSDRPGEAQLCEATRAITERVDWPCEVIRNYAETNLGCRARVSSGLDWVFNQTDEAIILEDDCLPDPTFFPYCDELLEHYRNEPRVHMISGTNVLPPGALDLSTSYYFSRGHHTWGWASWSRAWEHYDVDMTAWPRLRSDGWLERYLPAEAMVEVARHILDETYAGRVSTWDYQWAFAGWVTDALCVTPARNLVTNTGFGSEASHAHDPTDPMANRQTSPLDFPLRHPLAIEADAEADAAAWAATYPDQFRPVAPERPLRVLRRARSMLRSRLASLRR